MSRFGLIRGVSICLTGQRGFQGEFQLGNPITEMQ